MSLLGRLLGTLGQIVGDLTVVNLTVQGTLTVVDDVTYTGDTTIGDTSADTLTINASWPQFTAGSIPFFNGSPVTLQQNNAKLYWNDTDNSLVVGKNTNSITVAGSAVKSGFIVHGGPAASSSTVQLHWHSATDTARHFFVRSRGNPTTQTAVGADDVLGDLLFLGHDGTDYEYAASVKVQVDGTPGAGDMPGRIIFSVSPAGSATPAEVMRVSSDKVVTVTRITVSGLTAATGSASAVIGSQSSSGTLTFATSPQTGDFTAFQLGVTTLAQPSAETITNASTLTVLGAPAAGANCTITNGYAVWIKSGTTRIDGDITLNVATSVAGSASQYVAAIDFPAATITFNPNQTGDVVVHNYGVKTLAENSIATITNATTIKIDGAPAQGANATITNARAFWVAGGLSLFDGLVTVASLGTIGGGAAFRVSSASLGAITIGSTNTVLGERLHIAGPLTSSSGTGSATARALIMQQDAGTYTFGTSPQTGDVYGWRMDQVTVAQPSAGTIVNAATLYIPNAPAAGTNCTITNAYAVWVAAGTTRLSGKLESLNFTTLLATIVEKNAILTIGAARSPTGTSSEIAAWIGIPAATVSFSTSPQTGDFNGVRLDQTTLTNPSAGTITNAATLRIAGAPIAGANCTITNAYSLWVTAGSSQFDGAVTVANNFRATSGASAFGPSVVPTTRVLISALSSMTGTGSARRPGLDVTATTTTFTTTPQTGDVTFVTFDQLTLDQPSAGTITTAATVKIIGAPIAGANCTITNNYAFWVAAGVSRFDAGLAFNNADSGAAHNVTLGTTNGTKWGTATTQKQAWWNATPIIQPALIGALLTDNTGGTADDTLADCTGVSTVSVSAVENNFADLAAKLNAVVNTLKQLGLSA